MVDHRVEHLPDNPEDTLRVPIQGYRQTA